MMTRSRWNASVCDREMDNYRQLIPVSYAGNDRFSQSRSRLRKRLFVEKWQTEIDKLMRNDDIDNYRDKEELGQGGEFETRG